MTLDGFQPPPFVSALFVALILVAGNAIVILMVHLCANGTIAAGGLAGIRTGATRSSQAAWLAGHRAARPVADVIGGLAAVVSAATLVAASTVAPYLVLLGLSVVLTLGSVVVCGIVADRAARRELSS